MQDKFKDECGVFGIFNHPKASELAYLGLYSLQHRGQESAGIATSDGERIRCHKRVGLVSRVFSKDILEKLKGDIAIGHVRYSTSGSTVQHNAQPFSVNYVGGNISIAHNGHLINADELRCDAEKKGAIFQTTLDSEVIIHLVASKNSDNSLEDSLLYALKKVQGSYSLLVMNKDKLIACRDPLGFRPLCLGEFGGSFIVCSETCALDLIGAKYVRDIEPGEMVVITKEGMKSYCINKSPVKRFCIFEYIYFARPDSYIFGTSVEQVRKSLGKQLAKEFPVKADVVIPVPDSGTYAALGFAKEAGIPFDMGFVRNHYIGRTFIKPDQQDRSFSVKIKLNPVRNIIKGKRVIVIDDSIVRGTTTRMRIDTLKAAGAKEIHLRISSPPITHSCFFGIDTPEKEKLIASKNSVENIRKQLSVDSLGFISIKGMLKAVDSGENFCLGCFTGNYPIKVDPNNRKCSLERNKQITFDL